MTEALHVSLDQLEFLPRDALDNLEARKGSYLYAIVSCPRKRINARGVDEFALETRQPDESWATEWEFNFREHSVHCSPPWTEITIRGPNPSGPEDAAIWQVRWIKECQQKGLIMGPLQLDLHYVGRTFGMAGEKTAKERLLEGHRKLEAIASHLLHHQPERVLYVVLLTPTFRIGSISQGGKFNESHQVPASLTLVAAAEGMLIEWASPCLQQANCGRCFNDRREVVHLERQLETFSEVSVGGIDSAFELSSPHRTWPFSPDAVVVTPA
jgi:hypothetical protein